MVLGLVLFSCINLFALCYDFNLSADMSKLVTWVNADGIESRLLLSQLQMTEQAVLVKKVELPYSFVVDENCSVTQSLAQATIFEANTLVEIQLQYIYMKGQTIISNSLIRFTTNTTINLDNDTVLIISSEDFLASQLSSSSLSSNQSLAKNLYMYSNQQLISFDSKLFSFEPSCYMLSEMTTGLCLSQQCLTLPPEQVYNMEIGTVIKNYSLVNGKITLPAVFGSSTTDQQVYIRLQQTNHTTTQISNITQEQVTISGQTIIIVNFQLSQIKSARLLSSSPPSLRVESTVSTNQSTYNVKITLANSQPVYAIKTIKLYLGEQLIESDRVMFKPLQEIDYSLVWRNDQSQIPAVEIYSQNLTLEGRYSMNNYVDFQYNEQTQSLKNSPSGVIQTDYLQEITTTETHSSTSQFIIVLIVVVGSLALVAMSVWCCRKIIFKRCYQKEKQIQKQQQKNSVKTNSISEIPQTAKEIINSHEFTFKNRQTFFNGTPFSLTKDVQNKYISQMNPEQIQVENKDQCCSINGQNPSNQTPYKDLQNSPSSLCESIPQFKIITSTSQDRSLSSIQNYSTSLTKRPLTKKSVEKRGEQEEDQTEDV